MAACKKTTWSLKLTLISMALICMFSCPVYHRLHIVMILVMSGTLKIHLGSCYSLAQKSILVSYYPLFSVDTVWSLEWPFPGKTCKEPAFPVSCQVDSKSLLAYRFRQVLSISWGWQINVGWQKKIQRESEFPVTVSIQELSCLCSHLSFSLVPSSMTFHVAVQQKS